METKFSIIIASYNLEEYIEKCIKSVLSQTFKNYEIIIVDGGSTDSTKEKILQYNNVKLIECDKDKLIGGVRNVGIEVATGKYIIFLDGDDYLNNDFALEKLDNLIGNQDVDVVYMGFEMIGKKTGAIIPTADNCTKLFRIAGDRYTNVWSKCWNREFLMKNNIRFPEGRYYEDVLFIYNAVIKVGSYLIADFPVHTYYSGRPNSITTNMTFKNLHDNIDNIEDLIKIMQEDNNEIVVLKIHKEAQRCKERLDELLEKYNLN